MSGRLLLCRERWQSQTADHTHGCCWESGHPDSLHHRCQCGAEIRWTEGEPAAGHIPWPENPLVEYLQRVEAKRPGVS